MASLHNSGRKESPLWSSISGISTIPAITVMITAATRYSARRPASATIQKLVKAIAIRGVREPVASTAASSGIVKMIESQDGQSRSVNQTATQ